MKSLGPDCHFAETFSFFIRDCTDVNIELEFENPENNGFYGKMDISAKSFRNILKEDDWKVKYVEHELINGDIYK